MCDIRCQTGFAARVDDKIERVSGKGGRAYYSQQIEGIRNAVFHFADDAFCYVSFRNLTRRGEAVHRTQRFDGVDRSYNRCSWPCLERWRLRITISLFRGMAGRYTTCRASNSRYAMRGRCSLSTTIMHRSHLKSPTDCTGFFLRGVVSRFRTAVRRSTCLTIQFPK